MTIESVQPRRRPRKTIPVPLTPYMKIGGVLVLAALQTSHLRKDCQYLVQCGHCGARFALWHNQITARESNGSTTCELCRARVRGANRQHQQLLREEARVCFSSSGPATWAQVARVINRVFPGATRVGGGE